MERSKWLLISSWLLAAGLLIGCKAAEEKHSESVDSGHLQETAREKGGVTENRSQIVATVRDVVQATAPRFSLKLHIESVEAVAGYSPAVEAGNVIEAFPNFIRVEGKEIDYGDLANQRLLNAQELEKGDRITAVVYYRGHSVLLMDWQKE